MQTSFLKAISGIKKQAQSDKNRHDSISFSNRQPEANNPKNNEEAKSQQNIMTEQGKLGSRYERNENELNNEQISSEQAQKMKEYGVIKKIRKPAGDKSSKYDRQWKHSKFDRQWKHSKFDRKWKHDKADRKQEHEKVDNKRTHGKVNSYGQKWEHDKYDKRCQHGEHKSPPKYYQITIINSPGFQRLLQILTNYKAYIAEIDDQHICFTKIVALEQCRILLQKQGIMMNEKKDNKLELKHSIFDRIQ